MSSLQTQIKRGGLVTLAGLAVTSAVLIWPTGSIALAQSQSQPKQSNSAQSDEPTMADQIAHLKASIVRLETQIAGKRGSPGGGKNVGKGGKGGMSGMGHGGQSGGMGDQGKGGKGSMGGKGGKGGMGGMGGSQKKGDIMGSGAGSSAMGTMTGSASEQASLPGFAGASHLYHIGASDFFLDHDEHIMLSLEQRSDLGRIREQSQLQSATFDRQIAELEQELWVLTASDMPDIVQIEKKIRQIAQVAGDQRLAFIRSVGVAAQVLSEDQRGVLVGDIPIEDESAESSL